MGHFVPHTDDELDAMLGAIGLSSLDQLFACVPEALRLAGGLDLAPEESRGLDKFPIATRRRGV